MTPTDLWEYILQPSDNGKKYQDILYRKFHFSRKLLQELKQGERVWIDSRFTYLTARGEAGQTLSIQLATKEEATIPGECLPLEILFEDDYLLAVNKPAGQVVHPNPRYPSGTMGNAVVYYWEQKEDARPFRPIHRLDRNTSGVVLVAKNRFAHQQLAWQLEHGQIQKKYLGFVSGQPLIDSGLFNGPIGLIPGSFIQRQVTPDGLPARTHYRVLRRYPEASLVEFILETGRTHQIRVHCQDSGHPLLGDDFYGGDLALLPRQALHSYLYSFTHPATGEPLTIRSPLPPDLQQLLVDLWWGRTLQKFDKSNNLIIFGDSTL